MRLLGTELETLTDAAGRFTFDGIGAGIWAVDVVHPALDVVGHTETVEVEAPVDRPGEARVELPSVHRLALDRCRDTPFGADEAVVIGRIVDVRGEPVAADTVRFAWTESEVRPGPTSDSLRIVVRGQGMWVSADAGGEFALCGVPTDVTARIDAASGERRSRPVKQWIDRDTEVVAVRIVLDPPGRGEEEPVVERGGEVAAGITGGVGGAAALAPSDLDPEAQWLASTGFHLRGGDALMHMTDREIAAQKLDSLTLTQLLRLVPRVETWARVDATVIRLHATEGWALGQEAEPPCDLDVYVNGSLAVERRFLGAAPPIAGIDIRSLTAVEVFEAGDAPVGPSDGCGAVLLWIHGWPGVDEQFAGSIHGRLVVPDNGEGASGVMVSVHPGQRAVRTDVNGRFDFGPLPPGRYRIEADLPEWGTWSTEVLLRAQSTADVTVEVGREGQDG